MITLDEGCENPIINYVKSKLVNKVCVPPSSFDSLISDGFKPVRFKVSEIDEFLHVNLFNSYVDNISVNLSGCDLDKSDNPNDFYIRVNPGSGMWEVVLGHKLTFDFVACLYIKENA
jgi:hypothetical protein